MKRHLGGTLKEEICYLDATQISSSIRDKKFSSQEVAQAFLERIEEINPIINALVAVSYTHLTLPTSDLV